MTLPGINQTRFRCLKFSREFSLFKRSNNITNSNNIARFNIQSFKPSLSIGDNLVKPTRRNNNAAGLDFDGRS